MNWREWFYRLNDYVFIAKFYGNNIAVKEEDRYQAIIARFHEEEAPKIIERIKQDLQTNNSGHIGKLEDKDG